MKVITLGQFERDLDRILDDVTDENEHYCVKTPVISDLKEKRWPSMGRQSSDDLTNRRL